MMHGLVWWCIGNEAAAGKHHDAIDHRDQGMDDVLDPDHRDAGLTYAADQRDERLALDLAQAAGDLVEKEHARARRQRAGELEPLAIEKRQALRLDVRLIVQTAIVEDAGGEVIDL